MLFTCFKAFSASPTPITLMRYQVSQSSTGAKNTSYAMGAAFWIGVQQLSPGPLTNAYVSFGDGTPVQNCTFMPAMSVTCQVNHTYTSAGTFDIVVTPVPFASSAIVQIINMTVNILAANPFNYQGKTSKAYNQTKQISNLL
jgi:hypothetical protein